MNRILIFIFGTLFFSGLGAGIANGIDPENPALQACGMLLMSTSPLLMTFIVKTVYQEGWQDIGLRFNFAQNRYWYFLSVMLPFLLIVFVVGLSFFSSSVSLKETITSELPWIILNSGSLLLAFLVASIGEELGWRGYLQSALSKRNLSTISIHLIIGCIWFVWHLPLLFLAGQISILEASMILVSTLGMAVVYGQLRIVSGTVWTCVLLHACSNALLVGFGSSNILISQNDKEYWFSLSSYSFAVVIFWAIAGASTLVLGQKQKGRTEATENVDMVRR